MTCHYLNQCWNIVNWTPGIKFQWNLNRNSYIFIHENVVDNVLWQMATILSRPQCVYTSMSKHVWQQRAYPGCIPITLMKIYETLWNKVYQRTNKNTSQKLCERFALCHDDVIKWKHFPRCWPFVRGIHRSPVNSPHKGQWRGALMFTLICARINGWVNNREAADLRRYRGHYDVTVMYITDWLQLLIWSTSFRVTSR